MNGTKLELRFTMGTWVGLALLATFSVGIFCASMVAFHPRSNDRREYLGSYPYGGSSDNDGTIGIGGTTRGVVPRLPQPREVSPPINTSARDEIKQQCGPSGCIAPQSQFVQVQRPRAIPVSVESADTWAGYAEARSLAAQYGAALTSNRNGSSSSIQCYATLPEGRTWARTGARQTGAYNGMNCFWAVAGDMKDGLASNPVPQNTPVPMLPAVNPVAPIVPARSPSVRPATEKGRYQLALFLGNDAKSQSVKTWFDTDANLLKLRQSCAFEIYTENNPLYRAQLSRIVQPQDFPAVLFLDSDGGHIYAAGGPMLPSDQVALLSDLRKGYEFAKSVQAAPSLVSATESGALRESSGYSWDAYISPDMKLQQQDLGGDCDDGSCDPTNSEPWRPGDRVRDILNRNGESTAQAILWANSSEIVNAVLAVAIVIMAVVLIKKFS